MLLIHKIFSTFFVLVLILLSGCSQKNTRFYKEPYFKKSTNKYFITPSGNENVYTKSSSDIIKNSKAMHRATMRSYVIRGIRYHPKSVEIGQVQKGIASWYGPNFHSKLTSNGEIYNMYASTAAHKTLPMNTIVKVDNINNGKSTIVRINDRGPFVDGRVIDLSNKAARQIGIISKGTANVRVTILNTNSHFKSKVNKQTHKPIYTKNNLNYNVQVGAFKNYEGAKSTKKKLDLIFDNKYTVVIKKLYNNAELINKVLIIGFKTKQEASRFRQIYGLDYARIIQE